MRIESIDSYQVLNSRGLPSLEVVFKLECCPALSIKAPQGASCGWEEPSDLLDGQQEYWSGKSVQKARERIAFFARKLQGKSFDDPYQFDQFLLESSLDVGREVNVALGLSFGFALSQLSAQNSFLRNHHSFPKPMLNFINGGAHADGALSIQEIMLVPQRTLPSENLQMGHQLVQSLKKYLKSHKLSTAVGDEGGFVLRGKTTEQVLTLLVDIATSLGWQPHKDYKLSLDCAANEYFCQEKKTYTVDNTIYSEEQYRQWLLKIVQEYPLYSLEDPFVETAHESYSMFQQTVGSNLIVIGDDLTTTNEERLEKACASRLIKGLILKPNQNGLFSGFDKTVRLAQQKGLVTVFSHRSGDTEDHWLTDLALYYQADFLKAGALARSERLSKYNQLLRVEQGFIL